MSPMLCDPIWHVSSRSGEASRELLYSVYFTFTLLYLPSRAKAMVTGTNNLNSCITKQSYTADFVARAQFVANDIR